jgi:uncharacterized protein YndB with AHSA1/START domain
VKHTTDIGFEISDSTSIQAPAPKVFRALSQIGRWWNSEHTVSGNARNLSMDLKVGGCFCEMTATGRRRLHMVVVDVDPDKTIRLRGALGPLQAEGVDGALTWTIAPADKGVTLTQTYVVGGYLRDGTAKWAGPVDEVLHEQLMRLKAFVETGSPEAKSAQIAPAKPQ